jgi:hypothetical protein
MKHFMIALFGCLIGFAGFAQDKIYTRLKKAPIVCEVTEINTDEVKYKPVDRPIPIVTLDKEDVIKIVYANGTVDVFHSPMENFAMYSGQHRWNAKVDMLSVLRGHTSLFLEHAIKPGRGVEYGLDLIGAGKKQILTDYFTSNGTHHFIYEDAKGLGLSIGMKFIRLPDYINGQTRLRHIMQGSYIKPGIAANIYSRNFTDNYYNAAGEKVVRSKMCYSINPNITFGHQYIFDNTISFEYFGSVGIGIDNVNSNQQTVRKELSGSGSFLDQPEDYVHNGYGFTRFSRGDIGLSLAFGIRVGYVFNWKKERKADQEEKSSGQ